MHTTTEESVAAARRVLDEERARLAGAGIDGELALTGGSSIQGLVTKGDIDLHLRVAPESFPEAVAGLSALEAYEPVHPEIWTPWLAAFERASSPPVGIAVTAVGSEHDRRFVSSWEVLRTDARAREEYNDIKRDAADYEAEKSAFFDRISQDDHRRVARLSPE